MVRTKVKQRGKKRRGINVALVLGVAMLVAITLAVTLIRSIPGPGRCEGIPLYYAQSVYGCIKPDLVNNVMDGLSMYVDLNASRWIVMFGETSCPYCKALHRFFQEHYGELYRVLWIDVDPDAWKIFSALALAEGESGIRSGIAGGVPQTLVIVNGTVRAVVVGSVLDRGFWDRMLGYAEAKDNV